jgi:hypothetical protein
MHRTTPVSAILRSLVMTAMMTMIDPWVLVSTVSSGGGSCVHFWGDVSETRGSCDPRFHSFCLCTPFLLLATSLQPKRTNHGSRNLSRTFDHGGGAKNKADKGYKHRQTQQTIRQQTTDNRPQTTDNWQKTTDNRQQAQQTGQTTGTRD